MRPGRTRGGIGRALIGAAAAQIAASGRRSLSLWVYDANTPAKDFYRRMARQRWRRRLGLGAPRDGVRPAHPVARRRGARGRMRERGQMMSARILAILLALLPAMAAAQVLQLPNGLALTLPPHAALQIADGFTITDPASFGRRSADSVSVRLLSGAGPDQAGAETRTVSGRVVRYRVASAAAVGSGGAEHRLTAWFAARGGHVLVDAGTQAEWPARPDFARAWALIADLVARNP